MMSSESPMIRRRRRWGSLWGQWCGSRGCMEKCANCDATIGNLETPFVWDERIVCRDCHQKLSRMDSEQVEDVAAQIRSDVGQPLPYAGPTTPPNPSRGIAGSGAIICPNSNCGYRGPAQMKSRTNIGVSLTLIVLWLLFG